MTNDMNDDKPDAVAHDEADAIGADSYDAEPLIDGEASEGEAYVSAPPAAVKRGLGWGAVFPLFLLAAGGGAAGGWALTQYVMPNYIPLPPQAAQAAGADIDLGPLTSRLEAAEKKLAAQSSQLSFLSSEIKSGAATVKVGGVDKAFDVSPLLSRLDALEARLESGGQGAAAAPAPVTSENTSAASAAPSDEASPAVVNETPAPSIAAAKLEALAARLAVLETALSETSMSEASMSDTGGQDSQAAMIELQAMAQADETFKQDLKDELDTVRARVSQLETDIAAAQAMAAAPTVVRETVLLPPFPREAVLGALTQPRDADSQGWLNRTLKKHISVRNPEDVARANATLDEIEALTASRDYAAALALVEAMPSDVRSLAGEWMRAVKAEVETP